MRETSRAPVSSTPHVNRSQSGSGYSQEAAVKELAQGQTRIKFELERLDGTLNKLCGKIDFLTDETHIDLSGGTDMSNISREELDAKLGQNKAEVESVASSMRADMAQWRELNNTQMSALQAQLSSLNSKIDGKFEGMEGKIDGLKTTSSTVQWMVGAILALLALAVALPSIQDYFKPTQQITTQQAAPSQQAPQATPKDKP